jgi:hypothetical protein
MRAGEEQVFTGLIATSSSFTLRGGQYGVDVVGTFGGGTATVQKRGNDGATYVPCPSINGSAAGFTAAGYQVFYLPPGTYEIGISGATGPSLSVNLQRIPGE